MHKIWVNTIILIVPHWSCLCMSTNHRIDAESFICIEELIIRQHLLRWTKSIFSSGITCLGGEFEETVLPSSCFERNAQGWESGRAGKDCGGRWTWKFPLMSLPRHWAVQRTCHLVFFSLQSLEVCMVHAHTKLTVVAGNLLPFLRSTPSTHSVQPHWCDCEVSQY